MRTKITFLRFILVWGIVFLVGLGTTIVTVYVINSYRDLNSRAKQIRKEYIDRQKQILRREVNQVVDFINYKRSQRERLTREMIKSRVYEAYAIAQNIYQHNRGHESNERIQKLILEALRPIRYLHGLGYYFATRLDGTEVLFADRPKMEGRNLLNLRDANGQYVIRDLIKIAKQSGEGFYEYRWTKPGAVGNNFKKISFIKRFEPFDWLIGTGMYLDDVDRRIQAELLSDISKIRFGTEGYISIVKFNGDALVLDGSRLSGNKKLWEVFNDNSQHMKTVFGKEYAAALKPAGDFIFCSHFKLANHEKRSTRISYIYGMQDLQWIVGAWECLDKVETHIISMQQRLNKQIQTELLYFVLVTFGIVGFFSLFFRLLGQKINNDVNHFISFFERAATSDEEMEIGSVRFLEFRQLAEAANKMIAKRKKAAEALKENEQFFVSIFESIQDGISVLNLDLTIRHVNGVMKKWYHKQLPLEGKKCFECYHNADEPCDPCPTLRCLETGRMETDIVPGPPNSDVRWLELFSYPIKNAATGKNSGVIEFVRDITQRKKMEDERERMQAQLLQAQKMESIGQLAGGVAHDYNNALSVIIGFTELTMDEMDPDGSQYENLLQVLEAAYRARDITLQLLAFARKQTISPMVIDLNTTVAAVLKMLRRLIGEDINLKWLPSENLWPVKMDPSQVDQILANLCVNARDAIEGVGKITIETGTVVFDAAYCADHRGFAPGEFVMLAVSDNGCGMEKEILDKVFEPFFTTKDVDKGTGLGLAMVYGIVKQNNGFINIYSEPQVGTTVKIYLPRHMGKATEAPEERAKQILRGQGETILLVEDDPATLKLTRTMLTSLGYSVLEAATPSEALDMAGEHADEIDLLVTDVIMPEMNGRMLVDRMRSICPGLRCMFISGYTANVIAEHGVIEKGLRFLQKPFSKEDLAKAVRRAMDGMSHTQ